MGAIGLLSVEAVAGRTVPGILFGDSADEMAVGSELTPAVVEWEIEFVAVFGRELAL